MEKRSPAVPEPMEMLAGHITDYLHYLKHDCGLRVSIHEFQRIAAPFLAQFLPYRIHDNPCCLYLKSHPDIWTACIRNQKRLSGYLEQGPFFGCCHCGIGEYVYPIRDTLSDTVIGFISVSGYFLPEHHALDRLIPVRRMDFPWIRYVRCLNSIFPIPSLTRTNWTHCCFRLLLCWSSCIGRNALDFPIQQDG